VVPAFLNLFTRKSYHVERFISASFEKKLAGILQNSAFDIVQLELLYMSPYIPVIRKNSKAKIVLRAHNIEYLIWERLTNSEKNPVKKFYLNHLSSTLKAYEKGILSSYDGIVPITKKDAAFFEAECSVPVCAVSFGINANRFRIKDDHKPENAAYHIAAMNWMPNEEGIRWFLKNVWPLVRAEEPNLKIYLAGREMPDWLVSQPDDNLFVLGEVPDASEFISSKTISIAPLLSGSGIRIKIIESMAHAKAVVSTTIGAEGINISDGENILIADEPERFARALIKLYRNPELSGKIGKNARQLIMAEHNTDKIIQRLVSFYREIL
jgi:glycosyltransferase involved in cell wall biosynthesis